MRDLICKRCLQKVGEEVTDKNLKPKKVKLCPKCKELSLEANKQRLSEHNKSNAMRAKVSDRMINKNPMSNEDTKNKVSKTLKRRYDAGELVSVFQTERMLEIRAKWSITESGRRSISENMKRNNPMKNEEYKTKMVNTFKRKVESGEIVYKKGKEHHLWKGNRLFSDTVRCQLYPIWIKPRLELDGYECQLCSKKSDLQVHHIRPLRSIIKIIQDKYEIKSFSSIDKNKWQIYIDEIISLHSLDDGITVCEDCHASIDENYNQFRKG